MISSPRRSSCAFDRILRQEDTLLLESQRGRLRLMPLSPQILRVTWTDEPSFREGESLGICHRGSFPDWDYTVTGDEVILQLPAITVRANRTSGSLAYYDREGRLLLREREKDSRQLSWFDSYRTLADEDTLVEQVQTPDGVKRRIREASRVFDRRLCHTRLNLVFQEGEHIYGLGQAPEGTLDLRGSTQYLHQANRKIPIPFFLSTQGYGLLSATDGVAKFYDNAYGTFLYTDADVQMDFYFLYGPEFDDIIRGYRLLTGRAPLLPRWAFGFIQSQERYESSRELLEIAGQFRRRHLGLDCLVQDWNSWIPGHWGEKRMDPEAYPDIPGMLRQLEQRDVHFMLSIWPNPSEGTRDYEQFKREDLLLPASDIYNAFDPRARKLYWQQTRQELFSRGIRAFWCDSSEPLCPEWTDDEPEPGALTEEYIQNVSKFIPRDKINAYGLVHAQTIWEGMEAEGEDVRVCNLTRSAHTGSQRYGTILWSGDICADWQTLRNQIPAGLNFCASGLPYWTLDIGGFFVKQGTQWFWDGAYQDPDGDLGFRELLVRWFQLGAFLPVFRSHGTDVRREPWHFGEEGDPFYDAIRDAIALRYSLMPYIYSEAAQAALHDGTMMRMLAFDYRGDETALTVRDQYLFGRSILVCPVTHPVYYEAGSRSVPDPVTVRKVYLPRGNDWYDFYTMERFGGGQWITVPLTLDRIPLFVKAGSILPMTPGAESTAQSASMPVQYRVFPGADGEFLLYRDEGDGHGYEKGEYRFTRIRWDDARQELTVE